MTYEEILVHLYDLDRSELRLLAFEALLISDGPDQIMGEVSDQFAVLNSTMDREKGVWMGGEKDTFTIVQEWK